MAAAAGKRLTKKKHPTNTALHATTLFCFSFFPFFSALLSSLAFYIFPLFFFAKSAFLRIPSSYSRFFLLLFQSLIFLPPSHIVSLAPPFENICPGPGSLFCWALTVLSAAKAFLDCVLGRPVRFFSTPPEMKCHAVDERCLRAHSPYGSHPLLPARL